MKLWSLIINGLSWLVSFLWKTEARKEVQNEDAAKENTVLRKQLDIANGPADSSDALDDWLCGGKCSDK